MTTEVKRADVQNLVNEIKQLSEPNHAERTAFDLAQQWFANNPKPKLKPVVLYEHINDVNFRGIVDLFTKFSNELELAANISDDAFIARRLDFLEEEIDETTAAHKAGDKVKMVDGCADVAFVAITQIYHIFRREGYNHAQASVNTRRVLLQVGLTNCTKEVPTEKGMKILKPEGWEGPKIAEIFEVQTGLDDGKA
ncbi:MAG: hypothetical protein V3U75_13520 [Methylococcaceae bacterium]